MTANELSQVITNISTEANIPKELQIHNVDNVLAGDNVNLSIKKRRIHHGKKANKQINLYNNIATKTMVPFKENSLKK